MAARLIVLGLLAAGCGGSPSRPATPATSAAGAPITADEPAPSGTDEPAPPAPPALTTWALPGFSIDLPAGSPISDRTDSYDRGDLRVVPVATPVGWRVAGLSWGPGAGPVIGNDVSEQAATSLFIRGFAQTTGVQLTIARTLNVPFPGGHQAKTWEMVADDLHVFVTLVECGTRIFMINTAGEPDTSQALQVRALESARCAPDPQRERAMAPPVVLAVPRTWAVDTTAPNLRLWTRGEAEAVLFAWVADGSTTTAAFEAALPAFGFGPGLRPSAPVAGHAAWETTGKGTVFPYALVTELPCGPHRMAAFYLGADAKLGRKLLTAARCQ